MPVNRKTANLTTIWLAIALVLACKELARRTGVASADWGKELRQRAYNKLSRLTDAQLVQYLGDNFDWDD